MPKISPAWPELASSDRASPAAAFASAALAQRIVAATRTLADVRFSETCEASTPVSCEVRRATTAASSNCARSPCRINVKNTALTTSTPGESGGGDGGGGDGGGGEGGGGEGGGGRG
eukprot:scaffold67639_cov49-Phaeocystis_antarctica.AAC.1